MRERKRKKRTSSSSSSSSRAIVVVVVVFVVCAFLLQSSISFSSAKTMTKEEEEQREQRLVVVLDGNRAANCAIERRARAVEKALLLERWPARGEEETTTTKKKKKKKIVLLLAADDRNDRCELLKRRLDEEKKKDYFEYATLPRDALKPIGGPRTRALSVRVSNWIRERRESNSGEEEVYAFVEDDSEALMYFAAMSKETRGGATESFYDDVSFATLAGIEFSDKSISDGVVLDDDDDHEEGDVGGSSEKMLDDLEARWMRMESRKRAETIEVMSLERRLKEIRDERRKSATEIKIAREMGSSFADESRVGVVMTHKNRPEYCEKAVEALLKQTHRKVEIVIVDDGSENAHVERLENFVDSTKNRDDADKSVQIVKIAKPGKYLGEARNLGCSKLSDKTEYVLFSDDDNLAETNEIETMLRVLVHTKADVVTASNEFFVTAANGTNVVVGSYHPLGNALFPGIFENVFGDGDANALWRKSAFTSLEGFAKDASYSLQDWEILAKASSSGLKLVTVPAPALYNYRTHAKSMSKQKESDASSSNPYEDIQFAGPLRGFSPLGEEFVQLATFSKTMRKEFEAMEKTARALRKEDRGGVDAAIGKAALKVLCKTLISGSTIEREYITDGAFDALSSSSQDNWHVHGEGGFKPADGAILVPGNEEMLTEDAASTLVSGAWQRIEVNQLEAEPLVLSGWAKVIIDASKEEDVELRDKFEKSADFSLHADIEFVDGTKKYGVSANFPESTEWSRGIVVIDEEKRIASITLVCMRRWRPRAALFDDISLQPLNSRAVACDLAGVDEDFSTAPEKQTRRTRRPRRSSTTRIEL